MSNDNQDLAEEALQKSKEQKRHTSVAQFDHSPVEDIDLQKAIKDALVAIDDGNHPENINIRDARLKALLVGLEDAEELQNVATTLEDTLETDSDVDTTDPTQSDVTRLLIRVGLQEGVPSILQQATEAQKRAVLEQASGF